MDEIAIIDVAWKRMDPQRLSFAKIRSSRLKSLISNSYDNQLVVTMSRRAEKYHKRGMAFFMKMWLIGGDGKKARRHYSKTPSIQQSSFSPWKAKGAGFFTP